jgi:hypothetical protein
MDATGNIDNSKDKAYPPLNWDSLLIFLWKLFERGSVYELEIDVKKGRRK